MPQKMTKSFDQLGGTLGRAAGNDLVLDDPGKYISRIHAKVEFINNDYYLLDVGGNPSLVNNQPLGMGNRVQLVTGDQVKIGEYQLLVSISADTPTFTPAILPLLPLQTDNKSFYTPSVPINPDDSLANAKILGIGENFNSTAFSSLGAHRFTNPNTDFFQPSSQPLAVPDFRGTESDHISPEMQAFSWVSPAAQDAASPPMAIPADYDPLADYLPPQLAAAPDASPVPVAARILDQATLTTQTMRLNPATNSPVAFLAQVQAKACGTAFESPPTVSEMTSGDSMLMQALMRGLGLPELKSNRPAEEIAELVGAMLREATRGAISVLMARTVAKRESRLEMTMISAQANNPLKFFPNAESALSQMLDKPVAGYMPPVRAYQNAFDDLKAHELATMAGMHAALSGVLERFDPQAIEQRLKLPTVMDKVLATNRKAKMWDKMVQLYKEMSDEADDDFQQLFGEKFSEAYEEQIERLRDSQK